MEDKSHYSLQVGDYPKERASGLTKNIKKLRRNWSLKKEDISKGLSKIKKSSKTLIEEVYWKETKFAGVAGRRKISLSQLLSTDQPELRGATTANNVSTFYVSGPMTNSPSLVTPEAGGGSEVGGEWRRWTRRESTQGSLSSSSTSHLSSSSPSSDPAAAQLPIAPTRRRSGNKSIRQEIG